MRRKNGSRRLNCGPETVCDGSAGLIYIRPMVGGGRILGYRRSVGYLNN